MPRTYSAFDNSLLVTLLKTFASIPMDIEGDVFGKIYEYFLGGFAGAQGSKGGEFFTPTSIVRLIVEIIEPYHGRMCDPASGSAGMFVQSAGFVARHKGNPNAEISSFGQEKDRRNSAPRQDEPRRPRSLLKLAMIARRVIPGLASSFANMVISSLTSKRHTAGRRN